MRIIELSANKDEKLRYLHVIDASTNREYYLGVSNTETDAKIAKQKSFGFTEKQTVNWVEEW